jgi:hypothetical protein
VIQRCAAFVKAHISLNMLRFQKHRTPWLTAGCVLFNTLLMDQRVEVKR